MNQNELSESMVKTSQKLLDLAGEVPPEVFQGWFAGVIANTVGNLPDDYWKEFVRVEPCGRPGCDCHLTVCLHGTQLFTLLRDDYMKYGPATQTIEE